MANDGLASLLQVQIKRGVDLIAAAGQHFDAQFLGLFRLGPGIRADNDEIGLLGYGTGHLRAQRLGPCLGLAAAHFFKRAGENDRLAGQPIGGVLGGRVAQVDRLVVLELRDDFGKGSLAVKDLADAVEVVRLVGPGELDIRVALAECALCFTVLIAQYRLVICEQRAAVGVEQFVDTDAGFFRRFRAFFLGMAGL